MNKTMKTISENIRRFCLFWGVLWMVFVIVEGNPTYPLFFPTILIGTTTCFFAPWLLCRAIVRLLERSMMNGKGSNFQSKTSRIDLRRTPREARSRIGPGFCWLTDLCLWTWWLVQLFIIWNNNKRLSVNIWEILVNLFTVYLSKNYVKHRKAGTT